MENIIVFSFDVIREMRKLYGTLPAIIWVWLGWEGGSWRIRRGKSTYIHGSTLQMGLHKAGDDKNQDEIDFFFFFISKKENFFLNFIYIHEEKWKSEKTEEN